MGKNAKILHIKTGFGLQDCEVIGLLIGLDLAIGYSMDPFRTIYLIDRMYAIPLGGVVSRGIGHTQCSTLIYC
jgi:hypothetical protein